MVGGKHKSCATMSWRTRFTVNAVVCIAAVFAYCEVAPAQTVRPGVNTIATAVLGELPQTPLYWHLDTIRLVLRRRLLRAHAVRSWSRLTKCGSSPLLKLTGDQPAVTALPGSAHSNSTRAEASPPATCEPAASPGFQTDVHQRRRA